MQQRVKSAIRPSPEWGPARDEDRAEVGYPPLGTHGDDVDANRGYTNSVFAEDHVMPPPYLEAINPEIPDAETQT